MTRLQEYLQRASNELGVEIILPFILVLPSGIRLNAEALFPALGPKSGMIVVSNYEILRGILDELYENGYGYSVLDEPHATEAYDVESYREMFLEWSGTENNKRKPS